MFGECGKTGALNQSRGDVVAVKSFRSVCVCALFVGVSGVASAQSATRTWVSGTGDDVNPCSRTAPCKTFAGAIAKTAAGGEIDVLDPGGYGTLTITKAITIDGGGGQVASALASGTNGFVINAGSTDVVTLRNLSLDGAGTTLGLNGVKVLSAGVVHLENVLLENFSGSGVLVTSSAPVGVTLDHVTIHETADSGVSVVSAGAYAPAAVTLTQASISSSGTGVKLSTNTRVVAVDSTVASNNGPGFSVTGNGNLALVRTTVAANNGAAVTADSSSGSPTVSLVNSTASLNAGAGVQVTGTGTTFIRATGSALLGNAGGIVGAGTTYLGTFGDNEITNGVTGVTSIAIAKQ